MIVERDITRDDDDINRSVIDFEQETSMVNKTPTTGGSVTSTSTPKMSALLVVNTSGMITIGITIYLGGFDFWTLKLISSKF